MIVCAREAAQGEGPAEPQFGAHFIPTQTSPGSTVSGDSVLWNNKPQQQNKHLRACQKVRVSQDQEEKGVGWMCVCEKRTKVSVISNPGDFHS